jgi:hypothetical protein
MFYTYIQTNTGGSFLGPHYIIVEEDSSKRADNFAEKETEVYFNGVRDGHDCECCGDRWSRQWGDDEGTEKPEIYGDPVDDEWAKIYYQDGRVSELNKESD